MSPRLERAEPAGLARLTSDTLLAYALAKPGAWQDEPWEGDIVAKVGDKIFAFLGSHPAADTGTSVGVKCGANRRDADEWLLQFPEDAHVMAYLGRSGWNTLDVGGAIPDDEILEAVDSSYDTIVAKLPKCRRPSAVTSLSGQPDLHPLPDQTSPS